MVVTGCQECLTTGIRILFPNFNDTNSYFRSSVSPDSQMDFFFRESSFLRFPDRYSLLMEINVCTSRMAIKGCQGQCLFLTQTNRRVNSCSERN